MANGSGLNRGGLDGGERLPWLEAVEDEDEEVGGGGIGRLLLVGVAMLAAIAVVVGGVALLRHRRAATADLGGIIRAPAGPYKERPRDAGGMKVAGTGDVAYGTSAGQDIDSAIDLTAVPEQPVAGPGTQAQAGAAATATASVPPKPEPVKVVASAPPPAPVAKPAPAPIAPPTPKPDAKIAPPKTEPAASETAPAGPAATIQLGAFSSEAKAKSAWKSLSGRFATLGQLGFSITQVSGTDKPTLYRLRASGPGAAKICAQLRVAGETCAPVSG